MSILEAAIGWLAPPLCIACGIEGATICVGCSISEIIPFGERCYSCNSISEGCRTCHKCRITGAPRHVWITTTYDETAKELVQIYKFSQQRIASKSIASLMTDSFLNFSFKDETTSLNYLIIPVPTATSRVRQRGFDHADLLAKEIANKLNLQKSRALIRLGQTRQVGVSRMVRTKQLDGKYIVKNPDLINGRNILLIDDVTTTGATLRAATAALRKCGARRVDALVFAKRL